MEATNLKFKSFLKGLEGLEDLPTSTLTTGSLIIQQSRRNELRRDGVEALLADLKAIYGNGVVDGFDIVQTQDGIVFVAENEPNDVTISWEISCTIKSLDYEPFEEADKYDMKVAAAAKKAEDKAKAANDRAAAAQTARQKKMGQQQQQ